MIGLRIEEPIYIRKIGNLALIVIGGVLLALTFPPINLGFLAYIAFLPLIIVLFRHDFRPAQSFRSGYYFGLTFHLLTLHWIAFNTGTEWYWALLSMVAAILYLSLYFGLFTWLLSLFFRREGILALWLSPFLMTAIEFFRGYGNLGFTWPSLAHSQLYLNALIQTAAVTGMYGITFWVMMINVVLFFLLFPKLTGWKRLPLFLTGLSIFLLVFIPGEITLLTSTSPDSRISVKIGYVQPNIDPMAKWTRQRFSENMKVLYTLTDSVCAQDTPDLVVWPETAVPIYLRYNQADVYNNLKRYLKKKGTNLLTGVPDFQDGDQGRDYYNAALLILPDEKREQVYWKQRLVPFGEYIPLSHLFPSVNKLNLGQGNFSSGEEMILFYLPVKKVPTTVNFSTVICYESIFPYLIRSAVKNGADFITIITNDAWFGRSLGPYQHASIARLRAVENRVPVIRCANTGISQYIDPYGRVLVSSALEKRDWAVFDVTLNNSTSIYNHWGEWFPIFTVLSLIIVTVRLLINRSS